MLIGCLPPRGTVVRLGLFLRQLVLDLKFLFDEGVRFPVGLRQLAERTKNTNRLLRQYLPRGSDLSLHSQAKLSAIARQLNERPRKPLLYQTPAQKFAECVAAIG